MGIVARGYSLIELIVIIVILSIIAVIASSRFSDTTVFQLQTTRDDIVAGLFYAQQTAIARDTATNPVQFIASSTSITVRENGGDLTATGIYPLTLPNGMALIPATLQYDKLGRTTATTLTLTDNSGANVDITVEATGYAY